MACDGSSGNGRIAVHSSRSSGFRISLPHLRLELQRRRSAAVDALEPLDRPVRSCTGTTLMSTSTGTARRPWMIWRSWARSCRRGSAAGHARVRFRAMMVLDGFEAVLESGYLGDDAGDRILLAGTAHAAPLHELLLDLRPAGFPGLRRRCLRFRRTSADSPRRRRSAFCDSLR